MSNLLPDALAPHLDAVLLAIFAIHFAVFAALSRSRRTWRHASTLGVFVCLMGHQALKMLECNPAPGGLELQAMLRTLAYIFLAITLLNLARRRWNAMR